MSTLANARLNVHLDFGAGDSPILLGACLWFASRNVAAFEWSEQALSMGLRLSPVHLPLNKGAILAPQNPFGGLHAVFSDSIPDGFGLRLMNNSFTSSGHSLDSVTPIHRLAWVGERGLGALTYAPALPAKVSRELMDIAALGRYAAQGEANNFSDIPETAIQAGGSAHGARPKFWASVHKDGKMVILGDNLPASKDFSPCLVKFAPSGGEKDEPFFEAACLELANQHGILAAKARLLSHPQGVALAVERFDRAPDGGRKHIQSLAAILNHNFRTATLDYYHLFQASRALSGEAEAERIYRQACFNVALSMKDDHSKNFAFSMQKNGQWSLSPAYDLCPNGGPNGWQTMSVSGEGHLIGRDHLLQFAKKIGLSDAVAKDGIDQSLSAANQFASLAKGYGANAKAADQWAKVFKTIENRMVATLVPVDASAPSRKRGRGPKLDGPAL